ncbi:MAG: glycosyltransferase, partial [Sedimentisphaerales bacterium]|nr:glycosyltransferase [Sedimentisphaerales bacterium]
MMVGRPNTGDNTTRSGRQMILHFVYAGDPLDDKLIAAPNTITRILFDFFKGKGITVRHYVSDDTTTEPDVADTDVVIGHPHPNRSTIIWKLFASKCARKYLLWPFHTQIPQLNRYAKGLAVLADKLFLISGPYWTDTLARTEYTEWASKIVRVDNAVDGLIFTPRKKRFNPPGKRGLFVFGRSGVEKGTEQLFELLKKTDYPVVVAGHYEQNDLRIISGRPNTKILGHIDWLNEEQTKCIFEICDFAVSMPISDASPTTLLESMAGGLVPITTPQCGYCYPSFLLLSLKDIEHNLLTLKLAQSMSEEELKLIQRQNRLLIEQQHNWQRFCDTIWGHIGGNFSIHNEGRTGSKSDSQPGQRAQGHTIGRAKNLKVAGDYVNDGTNVDPHSSFGEKIKELFARITPQKIIETGTYLGTGTTTIIANAIKKLGIRDTVFCTIEVNPEYYARAKKYFSENNIEVYALNGLSVPRSMLPSREEIASKTITGVEYDGIFVDHREENMAEFYYKETDFPNVPDDLLYKTLEVFDFKPDFVLLDSAGHMGNIEFDYLIEHLKGECYIALDDINHIKHHRDFLKMQSDERFEIIVQSDEKFGFCIARFDPAGRKTSVEGALPTRKKVLIVRPDSIGDFVLFAGTLKYFKRLYKDTELHLLVQEHIAELAQTCPDIERCITFNAKMMEADKGYADKIISQLKEQKYDVAIYPVYSRTSLGDYLTLESGAAKKITLDGDCSNLPEAVKLRNDASYTRLVPTRREWILEAERNRDILQAFGIEPDEPVMPRVWLTSDDLAGAVQLLSELKVKNPIVVCPFGQHEIRHWPDYNWAQLLSKYKRHPILICGAENNRKEADRIIRMSGHPRAFNLCGKTGLRQLAALLTKAKLCIGVESAAGHMAAAVGCPHVVIIGGGHFGRFMPYSPLSMLIYLPTKCYHCNWLCPRKFRQSYCITQIRVETVDKALRQALKKPRDGWTEPVLVQEADNRDFISQQPLEVEPQDVADIDLSKVYKGEKYLITAVVSTYNAEKYMEGRLEDLEGQTIADRLEIIVVDSGSQQNEGQIVKRFQKRYDNIKYIRTEKREPIYKAWNRAIKQASGKYITNANADDRLQKETLEYMVKAMEKHPDVALVYCDQDWVDEVGGNVVQEYLTPEFSRFGLLCGDCYISSNPVWRKSIHEEFGYFEEDILCSSGDWEFWLRVSQKYDCMRIKSKFGLRRYAPDCFSRVHLESRTGLSHPDIGVIYKCYHYVNQYGLSVDSRGISGRKLFSNWPQTRLMVEKTKARFENRKLAPDEFVERMQSFNIGQNPRLSIIVTISSQKKNESLRLLKTLESLNEQSCREFELIIVNSGRTAYRPAKLAKKLGYPLVWIDLISDFGPSFARNIALEETRGEYVAFVEQGSVADKDFVQNICNHFEQHKDIYALRGRVLPLNEESACFAPDYNDLGDEAIRTLCENGANCVFRKADVIETGGFDDDLFSREFVELSYRLFALQGRRLDGILYVPDVVVRCDYSVSVEERFLNSIDQQIADMTLTNKWPGPEIHFYMDLMRRPYGLCRMKFTNDVDWMVALAHTLEWKWPEASLIWVERALEASPGDAAANCLLGSVLLRLGQLSDAQHSLEKALG